MLLIQKLIRKLASWYDYTLFALQYSPDLVKGFLGVEEGGSKWQGFWVQMMRLRTNKSNIFTEFNFVLEKLENSLVNGWDDQNKLLIT